MESDNNNKKVPNPLKGVKKEKKREKPFFMSDEYNEGIQNTKKRKEVERKLIANNIPSKNEQDEDSEVDSKRRRKEKKSMNNTRKVVRDFKSFKNQNTFAQPPSSLAVVNTRSDIYNPDDASNPWINTQTEEEYSKMLAEDEASKAKGGKQKEKDISQLVSVPFPIQEFLTTVAIDKKDINKKKKKDEDVPEGSATAFFVTMRSINAYYSETVNQWKTIRENINRHGIPTQKRSEEAKRNILPFSRTDEENMMRTPLAGTNERACGQDEKCEWYNMYGQIKTAGVEYLDAHDKKEILKNGGVLPAQRQRCIFCRRREVLVNWCNLRQECDGIGGDYVMQRHYNLTTPGEYRLTDMISSAPDENQGLPLPVVCHMRNRYTQTVRDGIVWYLQTGYQRPEEDLAVKRDFC